ncbi:MAG: trypco2 family protein [Planctomycetaceae bacterium]
MDNSEFDLTEVIECLRQQLREARIRGVGQTPRFLVDEAEVQLKVGVTGKREGGLNFKVFGIGVDGSLGSEALNVQTITLKLRPTDPDGGQWETAGTAPVPTSDANS